MDEQRVLSLLKPPAPDPLLDWHAFCVDLAARISHTPSSELNDDPKQLVTVIAALLGVSVSAARSFVNDPDSLASETRRHVQLLIALAYNAQNPLNSVQEKTACKILDTSVEAGFPGADGTSTLFKEVPKCFSEVAAAAAAGAIGGLGSATSSVNASVINSRRAPAESSLVNSAEHPAKAESESFWEKARKHLTDVRNLATEIDLERSSWLVSDRTEPDSKRFRLDDTEHAVNALVSAAQQFNHLFESKDCTDDLETLNRQHIDFIDCSTIDKLTTVLSADADTAECCLSMKSAVPDVGSFSATEKLP